MQQSFVREGRKAGAANCHLWCGSYLALLGQEERDRWEYVVGEGDDCGDGCSQNSLVRD
jgi:hypothetical protein